MAKSKSHGLKLTGEQSLRQIAETSKQLTDAVARHKTVDIDGTDITELDISIVQLLVASHKSANAAGKRLSVSFNAGSVMDQTLQRAGFLSPKGKSRVQESSLWARTANETKGEFNE